MSRKPIHEDIIPLRISAFDKFPVKAGIDRGSSLTKIVFILKDTPKDAHTVQLRCLTFLNDHFIDALHVMKEQAQLPDQGKLHITGVGAATYRHKIKEIIGLDIEFINEIGTIHYGVFVLINNAKPEDVFYPPPDFKKWSFDSKMMEDFLKDIQEKLVVSEENFPALVVYMGSGSGIMTVDQDGVGTFVGGNALSGKPFIGLAHALIGTADYNEIMKLAEEGNYTRADTVAKDLLKDDPDSPYGSCPPEMPIFPFGRASEKSWDKRNCSRADLAASLVSLFVDCVAQALCPLVSTTGMHKIYVSGNGFRHELPRKLLHEKLTMHLPGVDLYLKFLKTGHGGAVSAMLMDPEDVAKMMK